MNHEFQYLDQEVSKKIMLDLLQMFFQFVRYIFNEHLGKQKDSDSVDTQYWKKDSDPDILSMWNISLF